MKARTLILCDCYERLNEKVIKCFQGISNIPQNGIRSFTQIYYTTRRNLIDQAKTSPLAIVIKVTFLRHSFNPFTPTVTYIKKNSLRISQIYLLPAGLICPSLLLLQWNKITLCEVFLVFHLPQFFPTQPDGCNNISLKFPTRW